MICSRCQGHDPNCYVCRTEDKPDDYRDMIEACDVPDEDGAPENADAPDRGKESQ